MTSLPDTSLVELAAALTALRDKHARLRRTIEEKRTALDAFRAAHETVTLERDGNEALARPRALNEDLNRARDEAVGAGARLAAVEEAIARGDPVVRASEQGDVEVLEEKTIELRAKLTELGKRFAPPLSGKRARYPRDPGPARPDRGQDPGEARAGLAPGPVPGPGRGRPDPSADRGPGGRSRRPQGDRRRLQHPIRPARGTQRGPDRARSPSRKVGARLVELEVKAPERFPAAEIIERAHAPATPFHPRYWRDALLILLATVLLGEFLTHHSERETRDETAVTGIRVCPAAGALAGGGADAGALQ